MPDPPQSRIESYDPERDGSLDEYIERYSNKVGEYPTFRGLESFEALRKMGYLEPNFTIIRLIWIPESEHENFVVTGGYKLKGLEAKAQPGRSGEHNPEIIFTAKSPCWEAQGLMYKSRRERRKELTRQEKEQEPRLEEWFKEEFSDSLGGRLDKSHGEVRDISNGGYSSFSHGGLCDGDDPDDAQDFRISEEFDLGSYGRHDDPDDHDYGLRETGSKSFESHLDVIEYENLFNHDPEPKQDASGSSQVGKDDNSDWRDWKDYIDWEDWRGGRE